MDEDLDKPETQKKAPTIMRLMVDDDTDLHKLHKMKIEFKLTNITTHSE